MSELNTRIRMRVRSSQLQNVPVDDSLSISGQAADAKAVGDALAQKADLSQVTGIKVNGQQADNQGLIYISGHDVPVSEEDDTLLDAAIAALAARNATNIPMSGETGAQSIAEAVNSSIARNADAIPMESDSETMVKDAIEDLQEDTEGLQEAVEGIQGWTAADLPYETNGDSTKQKLDGLRTDVTALQEQTAADLPYEAEGDSVKDVLDDLLTGRVKRVNNQEADANGDITLNTVPYADDLTTDDNVQVDAPFMVRTAGGRAPINSGNAWIRRLKGHSEHTGFVAEALSMQVIQEEREEGADDIAATLNRATFISYVEDDAVISMVYSTAWKVSGETVDPADYGITVTGNPIAGDAILINYTKEQRGEITPADPEALVATGWNLFDSENGYARVAAYEGLYKIGGTYSTIRFATTPGGTSEPIVVDGNGLFEVAEDGYVMITGGNNTNTYVICCWSDWEGGYSGSFQAYQESVIDLQAVMANLPYGLCSVGNVYDEINFNTKQIIQRVKRIQYTDEARAEAAASGLDYEFDEGYIYIEMTASEIAAATSSFALENQYTANEHGMEFFTGTLAPVGSEIAYGASLKDKLRRDTLTISQQTLNDDQKAQVQKNIGADKLVKNATDLLKETLKKAFIIKTYSYKYATIAASSTLAVTAANLGIAEVEGYTPVAIVQLSSGSANVGAYGVNATLSGTVFSLKNLTSSAQNNKTCKVRILFARNELM